MEKIAVHTFALLLAILSAGCEIRPPVEAPKPDDRRPGPDLIEVVAEPTPPPRPTPPPAPVVEPRDPNLIDGRFEIAMWTNDSCVWCNAWKRTELPKLRAKGIKVGFLERDSPAGLPLFEVAGYPNKIVGFTRAETLETYLRRNNP